MNIYKENILDHYKNPRNSKPLNSAIIQKEFNPMCGDKITLFISLKGEKIEKITFQGNGCAISQAAASMLTEALKGKSLKEAKSLKKETMLKMLGIPISPARMKCALLGFATLKKLISSHEKGVKHA